MANLILHSVNCDDDQCLLYNYIPITFQDPLEAIDILQDLVTLNESVEAAVVVYLLGDILNNFNSTNMTDQEQFIEVLFSALVSTCIQMHYLHRASSI